MSRKYKGTGRLINITSNVTQSYLDIKVKVADITLLQKILESYENLAFVVPINPKEGSLRIHTTPDQHNDLVKILKTLPIDIIIEEQK